MPQIDAIPPSPPLRILLAEDHRLFRRGVRELLSDAGHEVVGEAPDGVSAVRLAGELRPDLVLMDVEMPRMNGVDATRQVIDAGLGVRVMMLTVSLSESLLVEALTAGAAGYLLKDAHEHEILEAVAAVGQGEYVLPPAIAARLVEHVRRGNGSGSGAAGETPDLTDREIEVLGLLSVGLDNSEIAGRLFVSIGTVKATVAGIFDKLGVDNRVQAAVAAVRLGLVEPG